MKFKYNVIGDNTAENREWLEKIGYKKALLLDSEDTSYPWLVTTMGGEYFGCDSKEYLIIQTDVINCIGKESLFKAISAIRDDSDYMQWFTDGKYWFENNKCANRYNKKHMPNYRKATLTELQERFKEKER